MFRSLAVLSHSSSSSLSPAWDSDGVLSWCASFFSWPIGCPTPSLRRSLVAVDILWVPEVVILHMCRTLGQLGVRCFVAHLSRQVLGLQHTRCSGDQCVLQGFCKGASSREEKDILVLRRQRLCMSLFEDRLGIVSDALLATMKWSEVGKHNRCWHFFVEFNFRKIS